METTIHHPDMVRGLCKAGSVILAGLTANSVHNLHMSVGISGEVAELWEVFLEASDLDKNQVADLIVEERIRAKLLEELGDIEFYVEGLSQSTGHTRHQFEFQPHLIDYIVGRLILVAGSVLDLVKKEAIYGQQLKVGEVNALIDELDNYLLNLYNNFQMTRQEVLDGNIKKLSKRYENLAYSDKAAEARADKVEEVTTSGDQGLVS